MYEIDIIRCSSSSEEKNRFFIRMSECSICIHLKPVFILPMCTHLHKVCRDCSKNLRTCPFCRKEWEVSKVENLHPRCSRDWDTYDTIPPHIHRYVARHIKNIGITLNIEPVSGIIHRVDPIKTSVEVGDMRMNILQYAIFRDGYRDWKKWPSQARYMYEKAYLSLVEGIDNDTDIYDLYNTVEIDKKKYISSTIVTRVRIYSYLTMCSGRCASYNSIYQDALERDRPLVSDALYQLVKLKYIEKNGDMYTSVM